jgi:protein-tyrosine phosphatase
MSSPATVEQSFNEEEQRLLTASLEAAREAGKPPEGSPPGEWVKWEDVKPVSAPEKIFHVADGVFIGSEYGAVDDETFRTLNIRAVINLACTGHTIVPNAFESSGVEYINYKVSDLAGADIRSVFPVAVENIARWRGEGRRVLVHCSAGLSRSASVVVAWLMSGGRSLGDAVRLLQEARGRKLQINPGFWTQLAAEERRLTGAGPGTIPSYDFVNYWLEDFGRMGFGREKIEEALRSADYVFFNAAMEQMLG